MEVESELLKAIQKEVGRELSFAAAYVRMKHVTVLFVTVYLFDTENGQLGIMK